MALKPNPYRKRTPPLRQNSPKRSPLRHLSPKKAASPSPCATSPSPPLDPHAHLPPLPICGIQNLPSGHIQPSVWHLPLPDDGVLERLRESGFALRPSEGARIVLPEAEVLRKLNTGVKKVRANDVLRLPQHSGAEPGGKAPVASFLSALATHYARRKDELSPDFFARLCLDYNGKVIDELGFYVGVLRLLLSSGAGHLVEVFRPLLPLAWRKSDLVWLDGRVKEDVRFQMGIARRVVGVARSNGVAVNGTRREHAASARESGGLVRESDSRVVVLRVPDARLRAILHGERDTHPAITDPTNESALPTDNTGTATQQNAESDRPTMDDLAITDGSPTTHEPAPIQRKKKAPRNGYRAVQVSHIVGIDESSSSATTPAATSPHRPASPAAKKSLIVILSPKATRPAPSPPDEPPAKKVKTRRTKQPTPPNTSSPTPSPPKTKDQPTSLPSASSILHLGPIYPTRRSILSRASKPYLHALCGVRFMHPQDVQRHHNGQGGRPGCWEKSGKEKGRVWDEDESCRVSLKDVEYRECREGWVVVDWGSAGRVEGVVGEAEEVVEGEVEEQQEGKKGSKAKMKGVSKRRKTEVEDGEEDDVDDDAKVAEKRQKTEADVARAAALGLRMRK